MKNKQPREMGVISDTHGLIRPQVLALLQGVEGIIHAGDVGNQAVLGELEAIAPVHAVCGNMDGAPLSTQLPATRVVEMKPALLYVLHDLAQLDLDPLAAGFAAVITGHTHRPAAVTREGVLFLNPGSAGPSRNGSPPTIARLRLAGLQLSATIIEV